MSFIQAELYLQAHATGAAAIALCTNDITVQNVLDLSLGFPFANIVLNPIGVFDIAAVALSIGAVRCGVVCAFVPVAPVPRVS